MKTLLLILTLAFTSFSAEVPDSLLTDAQKVALQTNKKVEEAKATAQVASTYMGIGRELGEAVNSSLSAITEQSNKFANNSVGHLVIFIVLFKVCKGLVVAAIGIPLVWLITFLFSMSVYRFFVKNHAQLDNKPGNGELSIRGWWLLWTSLSSVISLIATFVFLTNV